LPKDHSFFAERPGNKSKIMEMWRAGLSDGDETPMQWRINRGPYVSGQQEAFVELINTVNCTFLLGVNLE
jgi:LEA14-like dessication related protein